MQVELLEWSFHMVQSYKSGRAGSGLKFVKIFRANFGPPYKAFLQH